MALAATTVWEVRLTGNDNNGGGYAGGGTDYTMQDLPQATLTVASVVHTTTTQINVAVGDYTVSAADIGNLVQVTGGTATAGFYHITAVDVPNNRWTVDRAVGTAGQTVVGAMGGALVSPGKCASALITGNVMWVKAATYPIAVVTVNVANGCVTLPAASGTVSSRMSGYGTTRGDGGRPTLQASGAIVTFTLITTGTGNTVENFIVDGGLKTASRGIHALNGRAISCKGIACINIAVNGGVQIECEASGCSGSAAVALNPQLGIGCWAHDSIGSCSGFGIAAAHGVLLNCIASNNISHGFADLALVSRFINCTAYGNGANGFLGSSTATDWINCLAYGNTGVGIATGTNTMGAVMQAFLGANTGGATTGSGRVLTTVALTANPFVNAVAGNFALNLTAGGGALVRAAAIPAAFPGGLTTSYLDGGATQSQGSAIPTFPPASKVFAGVDRGDGVLGTLHASNIATAAGAGVNLTPAILLQGSTVDDVVGAVALPPANKVFAGTNRGDGVPGTLHASNIATAAGAGVNLTPGILQVGQTVDDVTGTLAPFPLPPVSKVFAGTNRGDGQLGTLHASNIAVAAGAGANLTPAVLLTGVTVDDVAGALTLPPPSKVYGGVNRGDGIPGVLHASNIAVAAGGGVSLAPNLLLQGSTVDDVVGAVVLPPANKVYNGTNRGDGVPGTLHASNIAVAAGHGGNLLPSILLGGHTVDDVVGGVALPTPGKVYAGVDRGDGIPGVLHASNISLAAGHGADLEPDMLLLDTVVDDVIGTLPGIPDYPDPHQVYAGVDRGDGVVGTLHASTIAAAAGHGVDLAPDILLQGMVVDDITGTLAGTVVAITVEAGSAPIPVGGTQQFTATAVYANGATQDITEIAAWTSLDPAVATIDAEGLASGVAPGAVAVHASFSGLNGIGVLAVEVTLVSIAILPPTATLQVGKALQFTATGTYSDGDQEDLTVPADWTSSDPAVVLIDSSGAAIGVKTGIAVITARYGAVDAVVPLQVTGAVTEDPNGLAALLAAAKLQMFRYVSGQAVVALETPQLGWVVYNETNIGQLQQLIDRLTAIVYPELAAAVRRRPISIQGAP